MPTGQHTDKDGHIKQPRWLHRDSHIVTTMHICASYLYLYILRLVSMPTEQHTDKNGYIKQPCRLRRDSHIVTIMHVCAAA